jgi:hypothetical protein
MTPSVEGTRAFGTVLLVIVRYGRLGRTTMPQPKVQAKFIDPMLLLRTEKLPEGNGILYELFLLI